MERRIAMAYEREPDVPQGEVPPTDAVPDEVQTMKRRALAKRRAAAEARSAQKQELLASLTAKSEGKLTAEDITTLNVQIQSLAISGPPFDFNFLDADGRDDWVFFDSDGPDPINRVPPDRI
jgi:hypothetical protein